MSNIHTEIEDILLGFAAKSKPTGGKLWYGEENLTSATKAIEALLLDAQAEGYKRGYIAGGIDELNKMPDSTPYIFDESLSIRYVKNRLNQLNKENKE
jgi:hypothetical protein